MVSLVLSAAATHHLLHVATECATEFVDITDRIAAIVTEADLRVGAVHVQSLHTTAALVLNEHEPLLLTDFSDLLETVVPPGLGYRHDDFSVRTTNLTPDERANGHAHCRALLLTPSLAVHVVDGVLQLGRWQRLFLVELDGPRERCVSVMLMGESGRRAG